MRAQRELEERTPKIYIRTGTQNNHGAQQRRRLADHRYRRRLRRRLNSSNIVFGKERWLAFLVL